jgi:hypothetical protein
MFEDRIELRIDDHLQVGAMYQWSPLDWRCPNAFFTIDDASTLQRHVFEAGTILMYLGSKHDGDRIAYIFLVGDRKFAVYNSDVVYGLKII